MVAAEHHPTSSVEGRGEAQDVAHGRTPEGVDRLVVVAHHRDVPAGTRKQREQLRLLGVSVLELVDHDVTEPPLELHSHSGPLAQQAHRGVDLVTEVDQAAVREQTLIVPVRHCQLALPRRRLHQGQGRLTRPDICSRRLECFRRRPLLTGGLGEEVRRGQALVLGSSAAIHEGSQEAGRVGQRSVALKAQLEEMLAEQHHGLCPADDPRV